MYSSVTPKQCSNITFDDDEMRELGGRFECRTEVYADMDDPLNAAKICITHEFVCEPPRRIDCILACLDEGPEGQGWYYQVTANIF